MIAYSSSLPYAQEWLQEYDSFFINGLENYDIANYSEAVLSFERAYQLALKNKDTLRILTSGIKKGENMVSSDQLNEAKLFLFELENFTNEQTLSGLHAELIYFIGSAIYRMGDFNEAQLQYERGLKIADPRTDSLIVAKHSLYLSNTLIYTAEYEKSHDLASNAIQILKALGDDYYLSRANLFKYIIYLYQGKIEDGELYLFESYNYAHTTNDPSLLRDSFLYLSDFYERKNDHALAITFSEKGLALAEELNRDLYKARYYERLGNVYLQLKEPDRALSYFNRAHQYYESIGSDGIAIDILLKIAECFAVKADYEVAEKLLLDALLYYKDKEQFFDRGFTLDMLARIKLNTRQYPEALLYLEENLKNSTNHGLPRIKASTLEKLLRLPDAYFSSEDKIRVSRELFNEASSLEPELQIRAYKNYSYSFLSIHNDSAFFYANEALKLLEKKRFSFSEGTLKAGIFADHATYYNDVASWYAYYEQDYSKAFELFESSKSRALLDQLAESRSVDILTLSEETELLLLQYQKKIDQLYRQREAVSGDALSLLTDEIADAELRYDAAIERIRREHPAWSSFVYPETLTLKDVQKLCDKQTGILEYAFLKEGLAIMLITNTEVIYHQVESDILFKEILTEEINRFRSAIINLSPKDSLEKLSIPLFEKLFAPFKEKMTEIENLVVVPDGSIALLPLDAIIYEGEYLVSKFTIKYLPSIAVFDQIQTPHRKTDQDLLAIAGSGFLEGNSLLDSQAQSSFATLPFTLIEVDTLASKFDHSKVLKNDAVSEAGVKNLDLSTYKYIHFATHGDINESSPSQSGLILSKRNELERLFGEDGYLNATEISSFTLSADMVVLSACNTGSGKVINGEGLLGLQRSFLVAGASSVVASLWSIYDRSTPLFMSTFYDNLIEYKDRQFGWFDKLLVWGDWYTPELVDYKALALRETKLKLLEHPYYSHPAHWASFVITGK
ncbi:MAG: hypothetical protein BalsKO_29470 [Balneolaceae bacterium]